MSIDSLSDKYLSTTYKSYPLPQHSYSLFIKNNKFLKPPAKKYGVLSIPDYFLFDNIIDTANKSNTGISIIISLPNNK